MQLLCHFVQQRLGNSKRRQENIILLDRKLSGAQSQNRETKQDENLRFNALIIAREMKTCSYCGKKYPDDATVCDLDQNPLILFKPKPPVDSSSPSIKHQSIKQPISGSQILSIGGFAVLTGLCGFGATCLVVGFLAKAIFKTVDKQLDFATKSMPILIAGGIVGFITGLVVSVKAAKSDPKTEAEGEKKYVGQAGRLKIYMGAPAFVIAVFVATFFEKLLSTFGSATGAYAVLGIALIIIAASLYLYTHIHDKFVIPIGIIGWMLTLAMIFWMAVLRR
jgi:hypothetical protein